MSNLKVLPNEYQESMERFAELRKKMGKPPQTYDLLVHYKHITPVFNRVGIYKKGNLEWMEFKLEDGTYQAVECPGDFDTKFRMILAEENPMDNDSYFQMRELVRKGFLPVTEKLKLEKLRRINRRNMLEARQYAKELRARIAKRIQEIKEAK